MPCKHALIPLLALLIFTIAKPACSAPQSKPLEIYFIDVEGGQATLFVTPEGHSLLIDTGWPGNDNRDADRIAAAAKRADISKIDYVLLTHYHMDHTGGVPQLLAKIPVGAFIDHGPNREPGNSATEQGWEAYQKALADKKLQRIVAKPGDILPTQGIHAEVVSADERHNFQSIARGRRAESSLRHHRKAPRGPNRKRTFPRYAHHLRQNTHPRSRRSHLGQGTRSCLPRK